MKATKKQQQTSLFSQPKDIVEYLNTQSEPRYEWEIAVACNLPQREASRQLFLLAIAGKIRQTGTYTYVANNA